jgi:hypothetical protein
VPNLTSEQMILAVANASFDLQDRYAILGRGCMTCRCCMLFLIEKRNDLTLIVALCVHQIYLYVIKLDAFFVLLPAWMVLLPQQRFCIKI